MSFYRTDIDNDIEDTTEMHEKVQNFEYILF